MIDPKEVMETAEKEFAEEEFRAKVEIAKERLRLRKSIWVRLFPWRIQWIRADKTSIEKRDEVLELMRKHGMQTICSTCKQTSFGREQKEYTGGK